MLVPGTRLGSSVRVANALKPSLQSLRLPLETMLFRELDAEVYTFCPSIQAKAGRVLDQPCLPSELQAARVTYTAPPPKKKDVIWLMETL